MIKKGLSYKSTTLTIIVFIILSALLYKFTLSKDAIINHVLNRDGYQVTQIQKPVKFSCWIEPDWIPAKEKEIHKIYKEIGRINHVKIMLEEVINRGNDIYFNFNAVPEISYHSGEFIFSGDFNEDGTTTCYSEVNVFKVYNKDHVNVDIGQNGFGPLFKFSFGIEIDHYDLIKNGFTLDYNGTTLYEYTKQ